MKITAVTISTDYQTILLKIEDAANVTTLRFWNNRTYKDYAESIDLSTKLTGATQESIVITLGDLNEPYFDGIYFFEADNDNETSIHYAYSLNRYKECIIDKLVAMNGCDSCLKEKDISVINAHTLLISLEYALEGRFIEETISIIRMLDKYCLNECNSCGNFDVTQIKDFNENNAPTGYRLDGGSID